MEKKINILDGCEQELEVKLSNTELTPYFDKAYLQAMPHIALPGFRKGKVPLNMIKKQFGKSIESEASEDIVNEIFQEIIKAGEIKFVGKPKLSRLVTNEEGMLFSIIYDSLPEFELADYKGLTVDEPVHKVDDEEVEKEIERLCLMNGNFVEADEVINEQTVVGIKLTEVDMQTGLKLLGKEPQETNVYLANETVLPQLRSLMMNKRVGDEFHFTPSEFDPNSPQTKFNILITDIQALTAREYTNEFVIEYTKNKFQTTEEFREEVGFQLQEQWDEKSRHILEDNLIRMIVDMNMFELPQSLVHEVMEMMVEDLKKKYAKLPEVDKLSVSAMEKDLRPTAEPVVKWDIIRSKIIEKEQIKVEDYDIEPIIEAEAERTHSDKESLKKKFMENNVFVQNVLNKKVMDLIIDFAITNEVEFGDGEEHDHEHHDHDHEHHDHDHEHYDHDHEHHDHDDEHHDHDDNEEDHHHVH